VPDNRTSQQHSEKGTLTRRRCTSALVVVLLLLAANPPALQAMDQKAGSQQSIEALETAVA